MIIDTVAEKSFLDWGVSKYERGFDKGFTNGDVNLAEKFLTTNWFSEETFTFLQDILELDDGCEKQTSVTLYAAFILTVSMDAIFNLWDRKIYARPNAFRPYAASRVLNLTRDVSLVVLYDLATQLEDLDLQSFAEQPNLRESEYMSGIVEQLNYFYGNRYKTNRHYDLSDWTFPSMEKLSSDVPRRYLAHIAEVQKSR